MFLDFGLDDFRSRLARDAVVLLLRELLLSLLQAPLQGGRDAGADGAGDLLLQESGTRRQRRRSRRFPRLIRRVLFSSAFAPVVALLLPLPRFFLFLLGLGGGESGSGSVLPPLEAAALGLLLGARGLLS